MRETDYGPRQQYYHLVHDTDMIISDCSSQNDKNTNKTPQLPAENLDNSTERVPIENSEELIANLYGRSVIAKWCAEPNTKFTRFTDIPDKPEGNCLFFSLIKLMDLGYGPLELRRVLLNAPHLQDCAEPELATRILSSNNEYGDSDCIYIFAQLFDQNVCVHNDILSHETSYHHFIANDSDHFIHLHLNKLPHYTPLLPAENISQHSETSNSDSPNGKFYSQPSNNNNYTQPSNGNLETQSNSSFRNDSERNSGNSQNDEQTENVEQQNESDSSNNGILDSHSAELQKCRVASARPPREKPPWSPLGEELPAEFVKLQIINTHPFRFRENLVYFLSTDNYFKTNTLSALSERNFINKHEIISREHDLCDVHVSKCKDIFLFGVYIKQYIDDPVLKINITKSLKKLKNKIVEENINSIGIIRDLAILSLQQWSTFVQVFENTFAGMPLVAVFFQDNLKIPPVSDRIKVLKAYHDSAIGGHRGMNCTYKKIARHYYWKNMRADVHQFILCCEICQSKKSTRKKTKLPMLISDTPATSFQKISMDFYGPLKSTPRGNNYLLTIQDQLTKFIILSPVKAASAEEVARILIDKVIGFVGPPAAIISDLGTHFQNRLIEQLALLFRIDKYHSTAWYPQSNGAIERLHSTITNYLRSFVNTTPDWDLWASLCQHSFNRTENEATGFSPHLLLFGFEPRTPSSFPPKEILVTYDKYLADVTSTLSDLHKKAALNQVQAKFRSKFYYDKKLNTKHFRAGEMVYVLIEPQKGKINAQYKGPFEIAKINYDNNNVQLIHKDTTILTHVNKIKRACMVKATESNSENSDTHESCNNTFSDDSTIY